MQATLHIRKDHVIGVVSLPDGASSAYAVETVVHTVRTALRETASRINCRVNSYSLTINILGSQLEVAYALMDEIPTRTAGQRTESGDVLE
jgi:hypothetical protein